MISGYDYDYNYVLVYVYAFMHVDVHVCHLCDWHALTITPMHRVHKYTQM